MHGTNDTPDLRGRFIMGAGQKHTKVGNTVRASTRYDGTSPASTTFSAGATGGWEQHKLGVEEMPSHRHRVEKQKMIMDGNSDYGRRYIKQHEAADDFNSETIQTRAEGGNKAHDIMPPYYVLIYIMKN